MKKDPLDSAANGGGVISGQEMHQDSRVEFTV
jgi:hypothetical protein